MTAPSDKSYRAVRHEFESAASAHEWVRNEVARFLFPDLPLEEAFAATLEHIEVSHTGLSDLARTQFGDGDLIAFEVYVSAHDGPRRALFSSRPSPTTLLLLCCDTASPGDDIRIRHYLAHRDVVEMKTRWPFPMDVAVSLVSPAPLEIAEDSAARPPRRRLF